MTTEVLSYDHRGARATRPLRRFSAPACATLLFALAAAVAGCSTFDVPEPDACTGPRCTTDQDAAYAHDVASVMDAQQDDSTSADPDGGAADAVMSMGCPASGPGNYPIWTCSTDGTQRLRCVSGALQTEACPNGCQSNPVGVDDICRTNMATNCPASGPGSYPIWTCSTDGTQRLRCLNGTLQTEACSNGCQSMPVGVDDVCRTSTTSNCPTSGVGSYAIWTCTADGTQRERCASGMLQTEHCQYGCQGMPVGTDDICRASPASSCPATGPGSYAIWTCSTDGTQRERCASGMLQTEHCQYGCQSEPIGTDDVCRPNPAACPSSGAGSYAIWTCSDDNTKRERCSGGVLQTENCAYGCQSMPVGTDDVCRTSLPPGHRLWIAYETAECRSTVDGFFHCMIDHTNFNALETSYSRGYALSFGGSATVPSSCGTSFQCAVDNAHFPVSDLDVVLIIYAGPVGGRNNWDVYVNSGGHSVHIHGAYEGNAGGRCSMQTTYGLHEAFEASSDPGAGDCCDGEVRSSYPGSGCLNWNDACQDVCHRWGPSSCGGNDSYGITTISCGGQTYYYQLLSPGNHEYDGTCVPLVVNH